VGNKIEYVCIANKFIETGKMKIKVESEKIIKAVKKLDGIEIVLENLDDAREAINLILLRAGLFEKHKNAEPKEVRVSSSQKYETTAVDYKMIFMLEFIFANDISLDTRVAVIKELQEFFSKV
jgi:copper chaperone CopZ